MRVITNSSPTRKMKPWRRRQISCNCNNSSSRSRNTTRNNNTSKRSKRIASRQICSTMSSNSGGQVEKKIQKLYLFLLIDIKGVVFFLLKDDDASSSSSDEGDDDDKALKRKNKNREGAHHLLQATTKTVWAGLRVAAFLVRRTLRAWLRGDSVLPTVCQGHDTKSTKKRTPYQKIIKKWRKNFPGQSKDDHERRTGNPGQTGCIKLPPHRADRLGFFHRVWANLWRPFWCGAKEIIAGKYCGRN